MAYNFFYNNITFKKEDQGMGVVVRGEIINNSGRSFNAVVFRAVIFARTIPIGNVNIIINGFSNGQSRTFENRVEELQYEKVKNDITKCEIYAESAY